MQVRVKAGQVISEPVTVAEFKKFIGYNTSDQDAFIQQLITAARELIESETGVSGVSKSYEVEFDRFDMITEDLSRVGYSGYDDGWYKLPFSPVVSITSVELSGVITTYSQKGLKQVLIHPDIVVQTGTNSNILQVEFIAGEVTERFNMALLRVLSDLFNYRESFTGVSMAALSFDTHRLLSSFSNNTGF